MSLTSRSDHKTKMPSLISRIRRGSEGGNKIEDAGAGGGPRGKRLSVDISHSQVDNGSPRSGKFKGIFSKQDDSAADSPNKLDSLRKKLTSPSTIFAKSSAPNSEPDRPITPPPDENDPALSRYNDLNPRTPPRANGNTNGSARFPSPATSPQQFALSRSRSPENGSGRNSWTPSYPLVVPDDGYADISPDGHSISPTQKAPSPLPQTNENSKRRSVHLDSSDALANWQPLQPDRPKPLNISQESGLPTPPTSTESRDELLTGRSSIGTDSNRPSLSVETRPSPLVQSLPADESENATPTAVGNGIAQPETPVSATLATPLTAASPTGEASPGAVARPAKPVRQRTNLITSPPMPQPIKNLPTLAGWSFGPGPASPATPRTPGWGSLARDGGPRTPGGMMASPVRTPGTGSSGFPFSIPMPRQTSRGPMSDGELRKAKRAMVCDPYPFTPHLGEPEAVLICSR